MPLNLPAHFIIFDTEYTTWPGALERDWSGTNEHRELVQIGALKIDGPTLKIQDEYQHFLIPQRNPHLSQYFIDLTHITQKQLDTHGREPRQVIKEFATWSQDLPLYCYGHDGDVVAENCQLLGMANPFSMARFHNIKDVFKAHGITTDNYMSSTIVEAFGAKPTRPGHDALNDALTILDGLRLLSDQIK